MLQDNSYSIYTVQVSEQFGRIPKILRNNLGMGLFGVP
jgi:hypothetical protein